MEMPPVDERPVIGEAGAAVAQPTVAISAAAIDMRGAVAATTIGKAAAADAAPVETTEASKIGRASCRERV